MSAKRRHSLSGVVARAAAGCALAAGAALALVVAADASALGAAIVFACAVLAIAGVLWLTVSPHLRSVESALDTAAALSRLDFAARAVSGGDGSSRLTAAWSEAAANIGTFVARLQRERAQLEALLNASSDGIVAVDAGVRIAYMNEAARHLFGFTPENPVSSRPFMEVVRDHDLNDVIAAAARSGERSVRVVPYGPQQRWLQATAVPIEGAGDWAALAVFHDLTEVRRLDSVRRDFISNVSHELRTPLAGIRAAAETLQEGALDDRPAALEFLGHIQREIDRLTQLVEELLELSRIESGAAPMSFAEIDAGALIKATARRFAQQAERAGLRITTETPGAPLHITGDAERLERALGNLTANAIKFTDADGTVTLSVEARDGDVALSVRDTGIGIEPLMQARVFERFYKTDRGRGQGGTGLGLAIVKHIALAHGGTVSVDSRTGRGSTFTILLPRR